MARNPEEKKRDRRYRRAEAFRDAATAIDLYKSEWMTSSEGEYLRRIADDIEAGKRK